MRIGLISDTHIPSFSKEIPPQVTDAFADVDLILHAGDIYSPSCLDWLEEIAPVYAVEWGGNSLPGEDSRVTHKRVLEFEGYAIGVVHELLLPRTAGPGILSLPEAMQDGLLPAAVSKLFGVPADVVVFGHTHVHMVETHHGILMVNPGSPTLPRHVPGLGTVGILDLGPSGPSARIVDLAELR